DGASGFDGLQNGNDLVFGESGFAHGDLLQEHNQYAGRSLNVNGPLYRDTYTTSSPPSPIRISAALAVCSCIWVSGVFMLGNTHSR
ncbi:hypothetical protein C5672_26470, partial [Klebsiella quasipneumoniae]